MRYFKNGVMNVHHREDESARRGRRHAHNLDVVHAHLGLAMLMAERGTLRVATGVRLLGVIHHRAGASPCALTQIRTGVRSNADLREEQCRRRQRADPL